MTFSEAVRKIISSAIDPMTPQEIRDQIKMSYSEFYGTPSHMRNVERGHAKNLDHALLAQIYSLVRTSDKFFCDRDFKPMKISLINESNPWIERTGLVHRPLVRTFRSNLEINYGNQVKDILTNAEKYHQAYYNAETFRGPSLYFHQRSIETRLNPGSIIHLEYVYATLASWGMHRMGAGGSKMQSFDTFHRSIEPLLNNIVEAQKFEFRKMDDNKWAILKEIFQGIDIMASGTSLVGNSKVMHHMLPNIVPPIDRNYTLRYLRGNTNLKNDLDYEWQLMKDIISNFFISVASEEEFEYKADKWMSRKSKYPWDTSILKIVDNLVIGSMK